MQLLADAGWETGHWQNVGQQSLPSFAGWNKRLQSIPPSNNKHMETFRSWVADVLKDPESWAANNPLIEVVAAC